MPLGPPCWAAAQTCPATRASIPRRCAAATAMDSEAGQRKRKPSASSAWTRHRRTIDIPSRTIPAPAPRRRSLRRRFAKRQRSRPGWPAWPPRPDKAWGARQANRSFPASIPRPAARPFPAHDPARIESIPPSCNKASHSGAAAAATKPAPPRHLDSSSKSGAPSIKVRCSDTRARPAKGMEVRSPLRRLWKAGRGAPAGATKPVCGAPRRPMRPRHRRGQTTPGLAAKLPR